RLSRQVVRGRMARLQHTDEVVGVGHDDTAVAQHGPPPHPLRPGGSRVVPDRLLPGTGHLRTRTGHATILAALPARRPMINDHPGAWYSARRAPCPFLSTDVRFLASSAGPAPAGDVRRNEEVRTWVR